MVFVIGKGSTGDFWRTVRAGASQRAREDDILLEWPSDFPENDLAGQARVVRQAVAMASRQSRPTALIVAPLAGPAYAAPIRAWMRDGIRTVSFDDPIGSGLGEDVDAGQFVSYVGTDDGAAATAAGQYLASALGENGQVAVLRLNPLSNSTTIRENTFVATALAGGLKVVSQYHYAVGLDVESAFREALVLLSALDDQGLHVDAIFCPNESTTMGMFRALENRGLTGRIRLLGFDTTAVLADALWKGRVLALVLQAPHEIGYQSVRRALEVLEMSSEEYQRQIESEAFLPTFTPFIVGDRSDLERCQTLARQRGLGELSGRALATGLLSGRSEPLATEPRCVQVLHLLYPESDIWHDQ